MHSNVKQQGDAKPKQERYTASSNLPSPKTKMWVTTKRTRLCVAFGAKIVVFSQSRLEKVGYT